MRPALAVVLILAGSAIQAQPAAQPATLDVIVDDNPRAQVLTGADFSVSEAGQPLEILSARLVQVPDANAPLPDVTTADEEAAAAATAGRLVGIYVDEYHLSDDESFAAARAAIASFIRTGLGPRDLVVVLKPLDSLLSIRLTADRERAAQMVETAVARQGDYTPRTTFEQNFIAGAPARIDAARNQIALSSLSALAAHLGRFEAGRKTLVVVSNGVLSPRLQARGGEALPGLESIVRAANRARIAIYAVRPSATGSAPAARDASDSPPPLPDGLVALAEQTTGLTFDGGAAAAAGLQRVLRDASRYYLLTLATPAGPVDGRFHRVEVAVRRQRQGQASAVRARSGYAAPRAASTTLTRSPSSIPEGLKIPRRTATSIRPWFGQSAARDGRTRVEFVWEAAPRVPGERTTSASPASVSVKVTTMDGAPVFAGASGPTGRESVVMSTGAPQLTFDALPGVLLVQMDVLDAAGRPLDHDVRDLVVGGFPGPLSFGTAAVYRARTARELRGIASGVIDVAPVASRQFSRAEHLVMRIPVVSREGEGAAVTARLVSRFGAALRDLPVTTLGPNKEVMQVDLPLSSLASGGYAIEFTARNPRGSALDRVEFSVTP